MRDYDRAIDAKLSTNGSTWGSSLAAILRLFDAYHITNSGTKEEEILYAKNPTLITVVSDKEGIPSCIGTLTIGKSNYDESSVNLSNCHSQIQGIWSGVGKRVWDTVLEDQLRQADKK